MMSYQRGVASQKQNCRSKALGNHGFLAEIADPPHHHQSFSVDHLWWDPSGITQQGGGHIHQRILQLETHEHRNRRRIKLCGMARILASGPRRRCMILALNIIKVIITGERPE